MLLQAVDSLHAITEIRCRLWTPGTTDMTPIKYHHVVKYDEKAKKITITRVFESGFDLIKTDLCTELSLSDLNRTEKTFERVSQWLGEALIFDTPGLRDELP
jgi:hypothetical protein